METLEHRIRRYLLARLRRRAVLDLYEKAGIAGLLEGRFIGDDDLSGTVWNVTDTARQFLTGARARDRELVRRFIGFGEPRGEEQSTFDWRDASAAEPPRGRKTALLTGGGTNSLSADFPYVSALLREHLPAPNPLHVAVALLAARAVGTSLPDPGALTGLLRTTTPFILVKAPVPRFEASLGVVGPGLKATLSLVCLINVGGLRRNDCRSGLVGSDTILACRIILREWSTQACNSVSRHGLGICGNNLAIGSGCQSTHGSGHSGSATQVAWDYL